MSVQSQPLGSTAPTPQARLSWVERSWVEGLLYALALIGTWLPWLGIGIAALDHNLIDLAEWTSLHPGASAEVLPYLTPLLLRLPPVCLALLIGIGLHRGDHTLRIIAVVALTAALLPPFEFLSALDNANYRQQAALALIALCGGIIGQTVWPGRLHRPALLILAGLGIGSAATGLARALALRQAYLPETQPGLGIVVTDAAFGLLLLLVLYRDAKRAV